MPLMLGVAVCARMKGSRTMALSCDEPGSDGKT